MSERASGNKLGERLKKDIALVQNEIGLNYDHQNGVNTQTNSQQQ